LTTGKLDNNLINIIEDDACIQGTRPEYVEYDPFKAKNIFRHHFYAFF